ncbi:PREDICTED: poly [ADP-ribose] polymerase 9 [Gekko japonicus]|uniref:Poly [ADP-ribose] polymerase 9 n=1 Tax=Gekko japonicus TaxID=146911 RepID=A0ABM1LEV1_GEKJA|nr:PREDICTED: poly [ADP-ribose] polymerase 9 [Gekko japonicus]
MSVDEEILTVHISSNLYAILKRRENYLCRLLQKKFGCITNLKSKRNPTEVYRKNLKEGVEVSVLLDDLTRHEADALVNTANENLHHFGGLAFALLKAGGPEIEEQCKRFIEKNGPLRAGQIAVTSGGRLPCKQVIHIVSPRWSEDQREECCLRLETAIINILKYGNAPENNIKSVAIPALSSGFFNFPLDLCAQVVVQTIKNFIQLAPLFGYLQEIHLVNTDEPTVEIMKRACEELLGVNDIVPLKGASDSITVNNLCLQIKKGNIENQQTAIIINSVIVQDDLSQGTISRAILEKAGLPLQEQFLSELQKLPADCSKLVCTKGYNITCEFVLHVIWPSHHEGNAQQAFCTKIMSIKSKLEEKMDCCSMDAMEVQTDIQAKECSGKNGPFVELIGCSRETLEEAGLWLKSIIQVEDTHQILIRNYSHLSLGQSQPVELSHLQEHFGLTILESLTREGPALAIEGPPQAVIDATFAIEFMLQNTTDQEHLKADGILSCYLPPGCLGNDLHLEGCTEVASKYCYQVIPIESYLQEFKNKEKQLEKSGLRVLKIEKIYNPVLESAFQRIKRKVEGKNSGRPVTHRLYHRVPAQYCSLVCKTGFQTTYSSSQDQKYGAGIYFNKNPRNLVADTREKCEMDHLLCAFEAEVVTGLYTRGNQSYVVPPLINASGMKLYDSVVDDIRNPEIFVIFNRKQALPLYLLTCSLIWNPGEKTNLELSA